LGKKHVEGIEVDGCEIEGCDVREPLEELRNERDGLLGDFDGESEIVGDGE